MLHERPRAVTMRVLDVDGREVHSAVKGGYSAGLTPHPQQAVSNLPETLVAIFGIRHFLIDIVNQFFFKVVPACAFGSGLSDEIFCTLLV